jgi:hypothetical protein
MDGVGCTLAFAYASESNKPRPALGLTGAPSECELLGGFSRRLFRPKAERVSNTLANAEFSTIRHSSVKISEHPRI